MVDNSYNEDSCFKILITQGGTMLCLSALGEALLRKKTLRGRKLLNISTKW